MFDKLMAALSKKLCLTVMVLLLGSLMPLVYKNNGVSDTVALVVLGLITAVGGAYGIVQGRIDLEKEKQ